MDHGSVSDTMLSFFTKANVLSFPTEKVLTFPPPNSLLESQSSRLSKLSVVQSQRPQCPTQFVVTIYPLLLASFYGFTIA
jgi:hypothetical protein